MPNSQQLHADALVIDGLVYHSDGAADDLKSGGIDAINLTACHFEADFAEACDHFAGWHGMLARANSPWHQIETIEDLDAAKAAGKVGLIFGWQNSRPIADKLDRLYFFHRLGLRIAQLTYNYRNMLGDGCLEPEGAGLTTLGRDSVRLMNELGIAIDLSHVGDRSCFQAIEASEKPVLMTHANAKAVSDLARNKSDDLVRALAEAGGVIGASIYGPMCWDGDTGRRPDLTDYLRHLEHLVEVAGIEHVGFGTDLAVGADLTRIAFERQTPRRWQGIDAFNRAFGETIPERYLSGCNNHRDLPKITELLLERGWADADVRAYLGGNFRRVLAEIWRT